MKIVELNALKNGAHRNWKTDFDVEIPDGWAIVSEDLATPPTFPFVKNLVQNESGMVIGWDPDQEAYDAAMEASNPLSGAIESRIAQSKADLAAYLDENPYKWTDGEYYSITVEKQNQLIGTLVAAQADGQNPEWNSTGGVCREWKIEELTALAIAIKNRVKSLVKYQQTQEVAMRNATSREELDAIVVDYGSVEVTA